MQVSVRSHLTAGVALVGAGAIAMSSITASTTEVQLPALQASSASVELSAVTNPLQLWGEVLGAAAGNIGALGESWLADPAPILTQIIANQLHSADILAGAAKATADGFKAALAPEGWTSFPAALQEAIALIAAGQYEAGFIGVASSFLLLGLPLIDGVSQAWPAIAQPFANTAELIKQLPVSLPALIVNGVISPLVAVAAASGHTLEALVAAAATADVAEFVNTVVDAPAILTGALLNGYEVYGSLSAGLLTPAQGWMPGGAVATMLSALAGIADAIKTPGTDRHDLLGSLPNLPGFGTVSPALEAAPDTTVAKTVTLDLTPRVDTALALTPSDSSSAATVVEVDAAVDAAPPALIEGSSALDAVEPDADDKAELSEAGTTSAKPAQQLRASLKSATDEVSKGLKGVRSDIKKSLKGLSGRSDKSTSGDSDTPDGAGRASAGATSGGSASDSTKSSDADSGGDSGSDG